MAALLVLLLGMPSVAQAWWNKDWGERRKVTLDAGVLRGVEGEVARAPVLVRLHSGVLDFTKVRRDGGDIRFIAGDDRTPLAFHLERFDPTAELGLAWVDVPRVAAGQRQEIWLYYGSAAAKPAADAAASYDGEQSLVVHFGDAAPVDATANRNAVSAFTAQPTVEGLVAAGARFVPDSVLRVAASPSLAIAANGKMTVSAWIKPSTDGPQPDAAVYTKLGSGAARLVIGLRAGVPYVRVVDAAGAAREAAATAPLADGQWAHLAATAGETVALYVDGAAVATLPGGLPALGGDEVVGANGELPSFAGDLDELGRANTDRSAAAIALAAQSQGRSASFAQVASEAEEVGSASSSGHFGVLFNALTPDAWVVIGLLMVMFVISWVVMIGKGLMLSRTARANENFLDSYRRTAAEVGPHDGLVGADLGRWSANSTLARLLAIGRREVLSRESEPRPANSRFALAPQSVAAIRSALDAGLAREGQTLNSRLVLLTIAISGGPFIGLLGTVLGVMITFAAVAAAGDVNINAIAPGIAAALLATVAGLAVAIPALFGYNYLLSQVDEIATENLIFVDELEKRLAETYRDAPTPAPIALAAE